MPIPLLVRAAITLATAVPWPLVSAVLPLPSTRSTPGTSAPARSPSGVTPVSTTAIVTVGLPSVTFQAASSLLVRAGQLQPAKYGSLGTSAVCTRRSRRSGGSAGPDAATRGQSRRQRRWRDSGRQSGPCLLSRRPASRLPCPDRRDSASRSASVPHPIRGRRPGFPRVGSRTCYGWEGAPHRALRSRRPAMAAAPCSHLDAVHVTELPEPLRRLRGVPAHGRPLGAPAHVPDLRHGRLLRLVAEPACDGALPTRPATR